MKMNNENNALKKALKTVASISANSTSSSSLMYHPQIPSALKKNDK